MCLGTHDVQSPLNLIGLLAHHSYKRDIFPLAFAFFYSAVIKTVAHSTPGQEVLQLDEQQRVMDTEFAVGA